MTVDKFDPIWGESGKKTPVPSDSKIGTGWVSGTNADQPSVNYLNYLQHRAENKINELADELICNIYDPDDTRDAIATGLWNGMSDVISGGATKDYKGICCYVNSDNEPKLLALNAAGNLTIDVYDARTMTLEDTSDDLIDDLPSGGGEVWTAISICTDGTYVYGHFVDTSPATDEHQVQSWAISDWSVNPGWGSTGTALTTTGACTVGLKTIINASSTKLAIANPGVNNITADSDPAITIVLKSDGSEDSYGAGDAPLADSAGWAEGICSDGTNIFFSCDGTANNYLCSATIADPTAGCGGVGYPLTVNNDSIGVLCFGKDYGIAVTGLVSNPAETDYAIITFSATEVETDIVVYGQNSATIVNIGDKYIMESAADAVFDGINFWILANIDNTAATNMIAAVKIDSGKLFGKAISELKQLEDICAAPIGIDSFASEAIQGYNHIVFDGRDLWSIIEDAASQTYSGKIYRTPGAHYRS